jgi:hypothetical protein
MKGNQEKGNNKRRKIREKAERNKEDEEMRSNDT